MGSSTACAASLAATTGSVSKGSKRCRCQEQTDEGPGGASRLTIRARDLFDVRMYEDRDWAARMSSALDLPVPASSVGLRVTSYVTSDPDDSNRLKILLAGEASRLQPETDLPAPGEGHRRQEHPLGRKAARRSSGRAAAVAEIPVAPHLHRPGCRDGQLRACRIGRSSGRCSTG